MTNFLIKTVFLLFMMSCGLISDFHEKLTKTTKKPESELNKIKDDTNSLTTKALDDKTQEYDYGGGYYGGSKDKKAYNKWYYDNYKKHGKKIGGSGRRGRRRY
ncbi:hypothetical protein DB313_04885 (plasmid) [Borrelia turcica IST7]|uniref:Uncharacterized protein n=1 Tax=Borrelia turcica IST7 TaxID=1104446 RepID=A0A386PPS6_9SPIR|nr:hypothetical protein [Borrelia turcica]AYE36837.1 hypothetical protein DB313_04885 [Borrelia turcica IST7]